MDWSFGGGWLAAALGIVCVVLVVTWWLDRSRLLARSAQIRLLAEAESDRLRLRISALKPVETRVVDLQTELAGLRPTAARVPELEARISELRDAVAATDSSALELEREAAALRARVTDIDQLELEAARSVTRTAELERDLAAATERLIGLERVDARLQASRDEIDRLTKRIDAAVDRERELSRQIGGLTETAANNRESAILADSRIEAAEALIARRDEVILALEQRLAARQAVPGANGTEPPSSDGAAKAERKAAKAERKAAKAERKAARERAERMQRMAERAAAQSAIAPAPEGVAAAADDLKVVSGIGPVMERTLNELGIWRLDQLAGLDDAESAALSSRLPGLPGRVERDGWVAQARALVEGGEESERVSAPPA